MSINTTVAHESLEALDAMVDVAGELGVDAIGLNHLMFSTPEEVAETVRLIGATDASVIATFITPDPGLDIARVRQKVDGARREVPASATSCSTTGPRCTRQLIENYYTPGAKLEGRCLYPFLHARVGFSGKVYFCPFIRVEVGDLADVVARGDLERSDLRRDAAAAARERDLSGLPPLLQGGAVARAGGAAVPGGAPSAGAPFR